MAPGEADLMHPIHMATSVTALKSPAYKVLTQLRQGPRTVEELAKGLRLTANAVRNQLCKLEFANLVARVGARPGVSKPSTLYGITLEGQTQFSTIYLSVLTHFLRVSEGQCSGKQLASFMTDTGKSLAKRYSKPGGSIKVRAYAAARVLRRFGGLAEVRTRNGSLVIRSVGCPLAALTAENQAACKVLEGFLEQYVSASVRTCCTLDEGASPRCCFEIAR
jgi:predicted ArsR family transcriptional regulator